MPKIIILCHRRGKKVSENQPEMDEENQADSPYTSEDSASASEDSPWANEESPSVSEESLSESEESPSIPREPETKDP